MTTRRLAFAAGIVAAAGAALASVQALRARPQVLDRVRVAAATTRDGGQLIELEAAAGAFAPNLVHVRAGAPLRLRVTVRDRHGCATRLRVPDAGLDLALAPGGTVEADLPPLPPGGHLFTCGAGMVKGSLVAE